jgi:hypothetical protein
MADPRFDRAVTALQGFEDAVATVDRRDFGGVYRCSQALTLRPLNFVRVDDTSLGLGGTVTEAQAAAKQHGLKALVVDVSFGLNTNAEFEEAGDSGEEWVRLPRGIYVFDANVPRTRYGRSR